MIFLKKKHQKEQTFIIQRVKGAGQNSQNFLGKFVRFLGLKILRLFRLKVLFETDIIKG